MLLSWPALWARAAQVVHRRTAWPRVRTTKGGVWTRQVTLMPAESGKEGKRSKRRGKPSAARHSFGDAEKKRTSLKSLVSESCRCCQHRQRSHPKPETRLGLTRGTRCGKLSSADAKPGGGTAWLPVKRCSARKPARCWSSTRHGALRGARCRAGRGAWQVSTPLQGKQNYLASVFTRICTHCEDAGQQT